MKIQGKTVLITGASAGIGAAIAWDMAKAGAARLLLVARREERLREVAAGLSGSVAEAAVYPADLSDLTAVEDLARRILSEHGAPDILVHNAGVGRWRFLDEGGAEEVVETMALPYLAAAWLTRALLPAMRERRSGHIVTVGSAASRLAWPGATTYIAAARALRGFADALRADLKGTGIGVTHYESGPVESPYWTNNPGSRERIPGIARRLIPVLGEDAAAAAVVRAVERNRSFTVVPARLRLVYGLHRLSPGAVQWLMTETGYRPGSG